MIFDFSQLLFCFSAGIDYVESDIFNAVTNHGKRLAIITGAMGKCLGLRRRALVCLTSCALLHDNAVSEFHYALQTGKKPDMKIHCIKGEENAQTLPFPDDIKGFILYHHEFVDKSGPFATDANDVPLEAQLIALVDNLDVHFDLGHGANNRIDEIKSYVEARRGTYYTEIAAKTFLQVLSGDLLDMLRNDKVDNAFYDVIPRWYVDETISVEMKIAEIVARITDNKSVFTAKHSTQIANKAYLMAQYYNFDEDTCGKIYIAASFHDIGKLMIPTEILEKPGKLTKEEYEIIKSHVHWSYVLLKDIDGMEEICKWAVTHHRKLDGTGYPDLPAICLTNDFVFRLMACIDIYQAVRETRPYHNGRTHEETIFIMNEMVLAGEIDKRITDDLNKVMSYFIDGDGDVPHPFTEKYKALSEIICCQHESLSSGRH